VLVRFPATRHGLGFATSPALWEYVRHQAGSWEILHLHAARGPFGVAAAAAPSGRLVFTPHACIQRLVRWPHAPAVRAVVNRAARVVALSSAEAELIRGIFPHAAHRVEAMPSAVDLTAIRGAAPFDYPGHAVVASGRLDRRLERAIAAMAGLDEHFGLVILGNGSAARRLERYAGDLDVGARVLFAGRAPASVHYRWLRTAHVVVTLAEGEPSGSELLEALAAGAAAVASDIDVHRETVAATAAEARVRFVEPDCSPLELADAIADLAGAGATPGDAPEIPSEAGVAESMVALYRSLGAPGAANQLISRVA
jgi:glycosyltransferase involved in cell wall biosynthesis